MQNCNLPYIPIHLHSVGKNIINSFSIGEELYYRCNLNECTKPYQNISLYDVSHNRNFNDCQTYPKDDVLFNIDPNNPEERVLGKHINTTLIKSLSINNTFEKSLVSESDKNITAHIKLIHDPNPCMYSHCVFEISLNQIVINKQNYSSELNKSNKTYKNLRRDIRQELTSIIYSSLIDNNSDFEIITDL
jgi:hypothetical protein